MEKLEALIGGKKEKIEEPDLEKATNIKKEIAEITQGKSLDSLELSQLQEILKKYQQMENVLGISKKIEGSVQEQMDMAREVMGEEFFGVSAVEKAFGIRISPEDIPEIPFKKEELERAKELNQFLVLRVDKAQDGKPLSLQKINEILKCKMIDESKFLYGGDGTGKIKDDCWYKNEDFAKTETPKLSWTLTSKEIIPNSNDKNYLEQTAEIAEYLKSKIFNGFEMPEVYQEVISEFEKEKDAIGKLIDSNWQKASEKLSQLKINQLTRQNPVEAVYDIVIYFQNKSERILEKDYAWTSRRDSSGGLVNVGDFDSGGVDVDSDQPDYSGDGLGVAFSRSL